MSHKFHLVQVGYQQFNIDRRYVNLTPCGDGSYGFVCSADDTVTGQKVAIKKITDVFIDLIDAKRILREIKLLRHFNAHENIVSILDIMTSPPGSVNIQDIYIVTNLMESDLERIIRSKQTLTDQHFQYFLYQILRGLKYIHSANVLHRDLKPSNLLVNGNCDLAVCDFGLARGFDNEDPAKMTEYVQTRWYRAPELLCESPHYGKPVDLWGVGCIFAELLTHQAVFQGSNPQNQLELIVRKLGCPPREKLDFVNSSAAFRQLLRFENRSAPPFESLFPPNSNPQALDLIYRMLQVHPGDRITVNDALQHPYLRDFAGQLPEPDSEHLFEFDFEELIVSKADLQAMMYLEMLAYRPDAGSLDDIPPMTRTRLASYIHGSINGMSGAGRAESEGYYDSKMDEDSGDEMYTAREDYEGDYKNSYK